MRFTDSVRFTFILWNQNYCTSYIHYEFSPTCLTLPSLLLGSLSRQVHILNCVERMINTPTFSDSLSIPHTPKWFPNWFPFHVWSMLRACFSTLVCTPFRELLILFRSFSALIWLFFRQHYDYFPRLARYTFVLSSPVLFLPYSHTQTSRHLSRTTLTHFQNILAKAQTTYTKKVSSPPTGCQFKK